MHYSIFDDVIIVLNKLLLIVLYVLLSLCYISYLILENVIHHKLSSIFMTLCVYVVYMCPWERESKRKLQRGKEQMYRRVYMHKYMRTLKKICRTQWKNLGRGSILKM